MNEASVTFLVLTSNGTIPRDRFAKKHDHRPLHLKKHFMNSH